MLEVSPKVYKIAETVIDDDGLFDFLKEIGQDNWNSNADSDADLLLEVAGRICYRSWSPADENNKQGTNENVTKVRDDNVEYVQNVIKQAHGQLLEHQYITLIFHNVSRVFTHELVRHRAGMAYSQESLRYVRLNELKIWLPDDIKQDEELDKTYRETVEYLESVQEKLNKIVNLNGLSFAEKKKWTSRFRRLAPIGLGTTILATGNLRAWRHIINMRGNQHAEEEIKLVMDQVCRKLKEFAPAVFTDLLKDEKDNWVYELNSKP